MTKVGVSDNHIVSFNMAFFLQPESLGVGSRVPEVDLKTFDAGELGKKDVSEITPKDVNTKDLFAKKTVAVFTITGAFTPVVSAQF